MVGVGKRAERQIEKGKNREEEQKWYKGKVEGGEGQMMPEGEKIIQWMR